MKLLIVLFFVLISVNFFGQNPVFRIMNQIDVVADTNYILAKTIFSKTEKNFEIDPAEKLNFLFYSLQNGDLIFFKKTVHKLILNNGFRYTKDNQEIYERYSHFTPLLKKYNLEDWLIKESIKFYPRWIRKHPISFEVQNEMERLLQLDQARTYFYDILYNTCADSMSVELKIQKLDEDNLNSLIRITEKIGVLPNHFDHGIGTYYLWQICFLHNLYPEKIYAVWDRMLPYIEKAYFSGKIGDSLFRIYDKQLFMLFGVQYYGTLNDVPVLDTENLEKRKIKYGLE